MSQGLFITATDTDAGKTWVTQHLLQAFLAQGIHAQAIKPIACGIQADGMNEDIDKLLREQNLHHASDINLYCFKQPAAPSIAAAAEEQTIEPKRLKTWCEKKYNQADVCLIEAVGGLMVPLTSQYLVSDWLADLADSINLQVVLVVGAKLGCINHALLSLEKLSTMQQEPNYIIINQTEKSQDLVATHHALQPYLPKHCKVLLCPYQQTKPVETLALHIINNSLKSL